MYSYCFFDLDGTLTDPGIGITNSVIYSLKKLGIEEKDRTELFKFIGPPLIESYIKYYGFSEEQAEKAVFYYREYFRETGILENKLYEGIIELLEKLKAQKKILVLATSKPEEFVVRILKHFDIYKYFEFVGAATMDGSRSKKKDIIKYAIDNLNIKDKSEIIMIGDREQDILGAKDNDVDSIGVLYGYGAYEELVNAGAKYVVKEPGEIMSIVF